MVHHQLLSEWARIHLESLDLEAARATIRDMRRSTEISGDDRGDVMENDLLEAQVDILEGDLGAGFDTISESAYGARDAGYENVALTSFRDGSVLAFRMMDRDRADRLLDDGVRYAESTDQSHCRNVMAATSGLQSWANGEWTAAAQIARQTIADHGSQRSVVTARWAVGYVALGRGAHLSRRNGAGCGPRGRGGERHDRPHPATALGAGRGRAPGRPARPRRRALPPGTGVGAGDR